MKVYISVDMEGATGICSAEQCRKDSPMFTEARQLLLSDVNAAVDGAFAGGAVEVIVADMHNGSFNLPHMDVDSRAKVIYGTPHYGPRLPFLDESVDVMFLIAYHAKAGTLHGTLEHTMSSQDWYKLEVNGTEIGEIGVEAALAGSVGVPVVMVTGDDKLCNEAKTLLGNIEAVEVKKGVGRQRALCLSIGDTKKMIFEGAKKAMLLKDKVKPFKFASPVEVALTLKSTAYADGISPLNNPNVKRIDGCTVVSSYTSFPDWVGGM